MTKIRVGVSPWTHMKLQCFPSRQKHCSAGPELDILEVITDVLGLDVEIVLNDQPACGGYTAATGISYGMIDDIIRGKIDMIGNFCTLNGLGELGRNFSQISWPVWQYQEQFIVKVPEAPPVSFAPFSPFESDVWISFAAIILVMIGFFSLHSYSNCDQSDRSSVKSTISSSCRTLAYSVCGFETPTPTKSVWSIWLILATAMFTFYNTYILSALLHPSTVYRPFSDTNGFVTALLAGKYQALSYNPRPSAPYGCPDKACSDRFFEAVAKNGYKYYPNAEGPLVWDMIVGQAEDEYPKLAHKMGAPFVTMYLAEYLEKRNELWLIDQGYQKWSGFVFSKTFPFKNEFNSIVNLIGDYKMLALNRYARFDRGPLPATGDHVTEATTTMEPIRVAQVQSLVLMLVSGLAISCLALSVEIAYVRRVIHRFSGVVHRLASIRSNVTRVEELR